MQSNAQIVKLILTGSLDIEKDSQVLTQAHFILTLKNMFESGLIMKIIILPIYFPFAIIEHGSKLFLFLCMCVFAHFVCAL